MKKAQDFSVMYAKEGSGGAVLSSGVWFFAGLLEMVKSYVMMVYNLTSLSVSGLKDIPALLWLSPGRSGKGLIKLAAGVTGLGAVMIGSRFSGKGLKFVLKNIPFLGGGSKKRKRKHKKKRATKKKKYN